MLKFNARRAPVQQTARRGANKSVFHHKNQRVFDAAQGKDAPDIESKHKEPRESETKCAIIVAAGERKFSTSEKVFSAVVIIISTVVIVFSAVDIAFSNGDKVFSTVDIVILTVDSVFSTGESVFSNGEKAFSDGDKTFSDGDEIFLLAVNAVAGLFCFQRIDHFHRAFDAAFIDDHSAAVDD
jgi:hypothetical protein